MVWGVFSSSGVSELCILDGHLNAEKLCQILEPYLVAFVLSEHWTGTNDFMFMHDGSKSHTENYAKKYLSSIPVNLISWSACSPDVNRLRICRITRLISFIQIRGSFKQKNSQVQDWLKRGTKTPNIRLISLIIQCCGVVSSFSGELVKPYRQYP